MQNKISKLFYVRQIKTENKRGVADLSDGVNKVLSDEDKANLFNKFKQCFYI